MSYTTQQQYEAKDAARNMIYDRAANPRRERHWKPTKKKSSTVLYRLFAWITGSAALGGSCYWLWTLVHGAK